MSKVIFKKASYDYKKLKPVIFGIINEIGLDITPQTRVLIKPNLLLPARPEQAVLTHPLVVKAVAEYVQYRGGSVIISDSPATGSFDKIIQEGGYKKVFDSLKVEFRPFKISVKADIGKPFGNIDIARDVFDADLVINLAKLKTHAQMVLTLGVKNLFGCVVGLKKPEWHYRTGINQEMFARLLVQIYDTVRPAITIVDGILALEGRGPGKSGIPRNLGILAASKDALAVDSAICSLLCMEPDQLPTCKAGRALGLLNDRIYISGDFDMINDYKFPLIGKLAFGPKPLSRLMRRYIIHRPVVDNHLCRLCGECWRYCPAKAITGKSKKVDFDYNKCIRCYCCVEICPYGALRADETLPGKVMRRFFNI